MHPDYYIIRKGLFLDDLEREKREKINRRTEYEKKVSSCSPYRSCDATHFDGTGR
ncbi:hypothetical protein PREVCOP_03896 [Segatella copri DSM 18205]|uniref:Uncharacterized protein n=1 Tax=Segatella copri DSM 18205 TaxID=537011 RepID=D1P9L3_9BACT|nr:hypothetical protein PREVCOP_03896 [Segatella copri DSM 18205]